MHVEEVQITSLSPDPGNVRTHTEAQIGKLMAALKRWGQTLPLLVDGNNIVRVGNARLEAMKRLGWSVAKVVKLDLPPSEWTALSIADNKLHDDSEFDRDALAQTLAALQSENGFDPAALGFDADELAKLVASAGDTEEAPEDFPEVTEDIHTDFECPRCSYKWSGKAAG